MKSEWKETNISDVADLTVGFVGSMTAEYRNSGVKFIRSMNVHPFKIDLNEIKYISQEFHEKIAKSQLKENDVVIVRTGQPGASAVIPEGIGPLNCSDLVIIHPDQSKIDPLFLSSYINLSSGVINSNLVGAVQQHFNVGSAKKMIIRMPDLITQKKISGIIKNINDKIETNRRINDNLQEQAQAIYQHMILENADDSWTPGALSDIAVITMGQSPKGESYNEEGNGTVFFQGRAEFGFRFPTRRLYTTDPKRMARANDSLMSVRAPVGDMNVAYEDCCIGRGLGAIRSDDGHQSFILYTMLALRERLNVFNGEGTVFGSINRDALNSMPVNIPPKEIMDQFENIVAPIDATIRNNYDEICRLQSMRDSLLPRLMSGEIDVSSLAV